MQAAYRWRTASLVAGALLVGTVIGQPVVQAASAGLVRLEGGGSTHVASVSGAGRLSVDAGLPMTAARQVQVAEASAGSLVVRFGFATCNAGGIYKIPSGKALIITAVDFNVGQQPPGHVLVLTAGPFATPCQKMLAGQNTPDVSVSPNQIFPTGIPVPAGDAIGLSSADGMVSVEIYGYLVPAAAVPHNILNGAPQASVSGLVKPRH